MILFDPIFQGLAIALMAGEVASLLLSRMTVPVLYFVTHQRRINVASGELQHLHRRGRSHDRVSSMSQEIIMTIERALRLIAGAFVALSVLLGIYVDNRFLWFTLFVGLNLFQSAFTNWCPMMAILEKCGLRRARA